MNWHEWFIYDETSPSCLRWAVSRYCGKNHNRLLCSAGDVAGSYNRYWMVKLNGTRVPVHRVIWEMFHGPVPPGYEIDHEPGGNHNQKDKLRCVSHRVNMRNRGPLSNNTSGVCGVNRKVATNRNGYSNSYWVASWQELGGRRREKNFSVTKLGDEVAFEHACAYRRKMIDLLNNQGAGYTGRHGK